MRLLYLMENELMTRAENWASCYSAEFNIWINGKIIDERNDEEDDCDETMTYCAYLAIKI